MIKLLNDDYIGKYAKLLRGYASGLIGKIEKQDMHGRLSYVHVTKSGIRSTITKVEDIEIVDITAKSEVETKIYETIRNNKELKFEIKGIGVTITRDGEVWGSPQGGHFIVTLLEDIEKYRKEIILLRGKAHLSCPHCFEDCPTWIFEGEPCSHNWKAY